MKELYVIVPIVIAVAIGIPILIPYMRSTIRMVQFRREGLLSFNGTQNNTTSKQHLLTLISHARKHLDILCGSLHVSLYDADVAKAINVALTKNGRLKIRILTGPDLDGYEDETHPVWDMYCADVLENKRWDGRWEIRHLKEYPEIGQGRYSDGDLYLELRDGRDWENRLFTTYYKHLVYDFGKVREWLINFENLWDDTSIQNDSISTTFCVPKRLVA